jgi:DNA-directed RNA polymerase subunit omega
MAEKLPMKAQYIDEASKTIPEQQLLINMVSRRVRQLNAGSRPLIEVEPGTGLADIALQEIAQGKIIIAQDLAVAI